MTNFFYSARIAALAVVALFSLTGAALAHEYTSGAITIYHPWSPATAPGANVGAGYMKITNHGKTAVRLMSCTTEAAGKVELHSMTVTGGVMRMRPIAGGLVIPPGGEVKLSPSGGHLMLIGLKKPLVEEELVSMTLNFDKGVHMDIELYVESMGAAASDHGHH